MKSIRKHQFKLSLMLTVSLFMSCTQSYSTPPPFPPAPPEQGNVIKMALLLDTSNSMDGLIEQAKSQLWKIVNELTLTNKNGEKTSLEIALYEYGNDRLNSSEGYIRNVLPLSADLDEISEKLFALTTNGGSEYCGYVIKTATNQLNWTQEANTLNLIFIAGNEPFNQGPVDFNESCKIAFDKGITINTIYCGNNQEGINTQWLTGAKLTEGSYMNIDMNQKTVYVETPFDDEIASLNSKLNDTYIPYGSLGQSKKMNQSTQDMNSNKYGTANMVQRTISKSSHVYSNENWDLVDASKEKSFDVSKIKTNNLPKEMQNMTQQERVNYIAKKAQERKQIQKQIQDLNTKRINYIAKQNKEAGNENSLDAAMINAIKKQATDKGFSFKENAEAVKDYPKPYVDFDYFENLTKEVKAHRAERLISFNQFKKMSKQEGVIVLDTRSKEMYDRRHIKGAVHLNFSNFTQDNLAGIIPSFDTKILIYCNNNFKQDKPEIVEVFPSKMAMPPTLIEKAKNNNSEDRSSNDIIPEKTLALNIPTYINLYGYGYKNVYELNELVSTTTQGLEFEGTDVVLLGK